ncbi:MAG: DEAD/DEAH box helicase family protein [Bacteroidetes bacterium]|nr:DEAD/DEAH box helicase family protein [Bacteroidota bacterium]
MRKKADTPASGKTAASKDKKKKAKKIPKIPYHRQPEDMTLEQWQAALRRQFGADNEFQISNTGKHKVFSDFSVFNPATKNSYRVAIRDARDGGHCCSCMDFKTNRLGTCKHIGATLKHLEGKRGNKKIIKTSYRQPGSSVWLDYRNGREIKLQTGTENEAQFREWAVKYFDQNGVLRENALPRFEKIVEEGRAIEPNFECYDDAVEHIISGRDRLRRQAFLKEKFSGGASDPYFDNLLKISMFPYQKEGAWFAANTGRCLLADEMGLGKTPQAIAAAELLRREFGIQKVLVVCPTSLKYQWKSEIEKFCDSSVHVVEGALAKRKQWYEKGDAFFNVLSYHVVALDADYINRMDADLIILDEAQRIKNFRTKVAGGIKKLQSPYSIVLTGTPIENRLEELYSIMQFIDQFKLPPLYQFVNRYQITNENGKIIGYRHLHEISKILSDTLLRRTKKQVALQLPKRMDKNLFVPMTREQMEMHTEFSDQVARLVAKWKKLGFLPEKDRQKLLIFLQKMRMVCDSTWVVDQRTRHDTKIAELMSILQELLEIADEKAVVFSQWERMTRLVANELDDLGVGYAYLHGGVDSRDRKLLLDNFRDDPDCRVFLSTDAGATGLNLQSANLLVNLDLPWNPALLEQRIARIYRLGQERNVTVINLISASTIEQGMLGVLKFKASMAEGVLDQGEDTIFMSEDRFRKFMENVENITGGIPTPEGEPGESIVPESEPADMESPREIGGVAQPEAPEVATTFVGDDDVPQPEREAPAEPRHRTPETSPRPEGGERQQASGGGTPPPDDLIRAGASFFSDLAKTLSDPGATQRLVASITHKDEATGQTFLKIPVENAEAVQNMVQVLGGLFTAFGQQGQR